MSMWVASGMYLALAMQTLVSCEASKSTLMPIHRRNTAAALKPLSTINAPTRASTASATVFLCNQWWPLLHLNSLGFVLFRTLFKYSEWTSFSSSSLHTIGHGWPKAKNWQGSNAWSRMYTLTRTEIAHELYWKGYYTIEKNIYINGEKMLKIIHENGN